MGPSVLVEVVAVVVDIEQGQIVAVVVVGAAACPIRTIQATGSCLELDGVVVDAVHQSDHWRSEQNVLR